MLKCDPPIVAPPTPRDHVLITPESTLPVNAYTKVSIFQAQ